MQCSEHARDTLPVPVTALPRQCFGDKRSFSCCCSTASSEGKRSRLLFPAGKPRFTSRGMLVCPFGNTHLPSSCTIEQLCPPVPARGARAERTQRELLLLPGEPRLLRPTRGHPGRGRVRWAPQAARGAGGRAGLRLGCASPVQVRHLVPAPLRESREWPGMRREREPEQQEGPSLRSHQHQGWACLSHQSWEATA